MKKLMSLFAALLSVAVMTSAVSAAEEELDAYQIYTAANNKMESVKTMAMRGNLWMVIDSEDSDEAVLETSMGLSVTTLTKGDDIEMMMTAKSEELGLTTDVYYKDGYYYQKIGDLKLKSKMDMVEAASEMSLIDTDSITENMLRNATAEKVEGGVKLRMVMNSDEINDMTADMLGDMLSELDEDVSVRYGDIAYTIIVGDNGYIDSMQMSFVSDITTDGVTMRVKYAVNLKVTAINAPIAIPYPRDLDSYVDAGSLLE